MSPEHVTCNGSGAIYGNPKSLHPKIIKKFRERAIKLPSIYSLFCDHQLTYMYTNIRESVGAFSVDRVKTEKCINVLIR